jgi:hypothetical protein
MTFPRGLLYRHKLYPRRQTRLTEKNQHTDGQLQFRIQLKIKLTTFKHLEVNFQQSRIENIGSGGATTVLKLGDHIPSLPFPFPFPFPFAFHLMASDGEPKNFLDCYMLA